MSLTSIKLRISERLKDKLFREKFFRSQVQDEIAMQLRGLRNKRKLKQSQLAEIAGMKQSAISRIEQAEYSSWSVNTLFRVADALDAQMKITFEPIEEVIQEYEQLETESEDSFAQVSVKDAASILFPVEFNASAEITHELRYINEDETHGSKKICSGTGSLIGGFGGEVPYKTESIVVVVQGGGNAP
jgi:transcriptional regulator with XRE-family HTH domain